MAIRLRRPLALASVVTATLAGTVVLRSIFGGGSDEPLSPLPTATTAATPTPTSTPPPSLTSVASPLEKRVFAAAEAVTVKDGIGFLSAADGSLETWSWPDGANAYYLMQTTPDGALLVFNEAKEGAPNIVVDRASGKAWQLSAGLGVMAGMGHGAVFVAAQQPAGEPHRYWLANAADGTIKALAVSGESSGVGITSPDGRKGALQAGDSVYVIDLTSGAVAKLVTGLERTTASIEALPGALGFALTQNGAATRRWFTWDGVETPGGLPEGAVSPNGRYVATNWTIGRIKAVGMGGYPVVGAVTVLDRQPNLVLSQYLGAGTVGSRFGDAAWTSASDGLVVEVKAGYKLVSPSGQVLATFDDPIHALNPLPSPTIAGLLGTSRGTIINTARNQTIAPNYAIDPWFADWTTKPGELAVQLATPGKGRGWQDQVLPFEARAGGSSVPPRAVVKAGGDCLNLRERPEAGAPVVRCMADGSTASFFLADDPKPDPKAEGQPKDQVAGYMEGLTVWLHLTTADGASGWADANFLAWAK